MRNEVGRGKLALVGTQSGTVAEEVYLFFEHAIFLSKLYFFPSRLIKINKSFLLTTATSGELFSGLPLFNFICLQ
jgi:hypothetical protein